MNLSVVALGRPRWPHSMEIVVSGQPVSRIGSVGAGEVVRDELGKWLLVEQLCISEGLPLLCHSLKSDFDQPFLDLKCA